MTNICSTDFFFFLSISFLFSSFFLTLQKIFHQYDVLNYISLITSRETCAHGRNSILLDLPCKIHANLFDTTNVRVIFTIDRSHLLIDNTIRLPLMKHQEGKSVPYRQYLFKKTRSDANFDSRINSNLSLRYCTLEEL